MSRSIAWRKSVSDSCSWHQSQALDSTIYILRQTGPTGFLLQEEGEPKTVKVFLGDPHSCTCSVFKKERDLCKHICWILLRKFRLSIHDPLSWQLALVERDINEILQGRVAGQNQAKQHQKKATVIESSDGRSIVEQREIADDDVCPICQEEFLSKKLLVTYCKFGCGNSIHIKCMRVWAEHQLKTTEDGKIKCPMCREDFGPFDLLKTEMRNAGYIVPSAPGIRMDMHFGMACSHCNVTPIEGKCYRCTVCPAYFMCQRCFNLPVHTDHIFQFRQKRNQRWHSASRTFGSGLHPSLIDDLMHRELSENDYDLLLQLERNNQEELSSLSEETLKTIPIERVKEGGCLLAIGCQCRVCLRGFVVGQYVRKLPCKHKFHKECIDSWLLHSHPTCPIDGLLAISSQATLQSEQKNVLQPRTLNSDQTRSRNPDSGALVLTAFGIPLTSSRFTANTRSATVNVDELHDHRTQQKPPSVVRLELSGMSVGCDNPCNQILDNEVREDRLPGYLDQQVSQQRERISQQVRKMYRTVSAAPDTSELLTPEALIQYLQSETQSRPVTTVLGPTRELTNHKTQDHKFHRRPRSLLHRRPNSLERVVPSIQNVRQVVGDLFLGNNPSIQPAVRENCIVSKPPSVQRTRTQVFKSVFHNHLPSIHLVERSRNVDMRLDGSAIEYNAVHDQESADGYLN